MKLMKPVYNEYEKNYALGYYVSRLHFKSGYRIDNSFDYQLCLKNKNNGIYTDRKMEMFGPAIDIKDWPFTKMI